MADFRISLGVDINTSNIQSQINSVNINPINLDVQINDRNLQTQINNLRTAPVDINVRLDDADALRRVNNIRQQLQNLNNININIGGGRGNGGRRQVDETTQAYRELMGVLNELNSKRISLNGLDASSPQSSNKIQRLRSQIEQLQNEYNNMMNSFNAQGIQFTADQWNDLETAIARVGRQIDVVQAGMTDKSIVKEQTQAYKELLSISKEMDSLQVNLTKLRGQDGNTNQIEVLENQLNTLQSTYQQLVTTMNTPLTADQWSSIYTQIAQTSDKIAQLQAQYVDSRANIASGISQKLKGSDLGLSGFDKEIGEVIAKFNNLTNQTEPLKAAMDALKTSFNNVKTAASSGTDDELINANRDYLQVLKEVKTQLDINANAEKQANNADNLTLAREKSLLKLKSLFEEGSEAARKFGAEAQKLEKELIDCGNIKGIDKVNKQITNLGLRIKESSAQTQTFGSKLKAQFDKYKDYFSVATVMMYVTQGLKDMYQQVLAIDTAMTGLYRVTNLTDVEYDSLFDNMTVSAKEYGATLTDIINATTDWVRAGFDANTSLGLAEVTTMYQHISDLDYDTAAENLITAYNGFKDELNTAFDGDQVAAVEYIADIFNELDRQNCP